MVFIELFLVEEVAIQSIIVFLVFFGDPSR
jgi:hypothetical protein